MDTLAKNIIIMGIFERTLIYFKRVYLLNMHKNENYQGAFNGEIPQSTYIGQNFFFLVISLDCEVAKIKK